MAWKIERWLSEVFPGEMRIYSEYKHLSNRELSIVAAGTLDLALAELLSKRLANYPQEIEEFLGLNGDGRAPVGTFGSRIQLALLVGLITPQDAKILRLIKKIRNAFAHRIRVDFTSNQVNPLILKLFREFRNRHNGHGKIQTSEFNEILPYLKTVPGAGGGLLLVCFAIYQAYFHRLHRLVEPITIK